jgi:hypothetical protein
VEEQSDEMHKTIDLVIDNLKRVLAREKQKQVDHHQSQDRFVEAAAAAEPAMADVEEFDYEEFESATREANTAAR